MSASSAFTLFPKLPVELRLAVWSVITDAPRNSNLKFIQASRPLPHSMMYVSEQQSFKFSCCSITSTGGLPAVLQVNRESREQAKKKYKLFFTRMRQGKPIYIDIHNEPIFLGEDLGNIHCLDELCNGSDGYQSGPEIKFVLEHCRTLVFDRVDFMEWQYLLATFYHLKTLILRENTTEPRDWLTSQAEMAKTKNALEIAWTHVAKGHGEVLLSFPKIEYWSEQTLSDYKARFGAKENACTISDEISSNTLSRNLHRRTWL